MIFLVDHLVAAVVAVVCLHDALSCPLFSLLTEKYLENRLLSLPVAVAIESLQLKKLNEHQINSKTEKRN